MKIKRRMKRAGGKPKTYDLLENGAVLVTKEAVGARRPTNLVVLNCRVRGKRSTNVLFSFMFNAAIVGYGLNRLLLSEHAINKYYKIAPRRLRAEYAPPTP